MPWADGEPVADWWETDDALDPGGGRLVRVWWGSSGWGLVAGDWSGSGGEVVVGIGGGGLVWVWWGSSGRGLVRRAGLPHHYFPTRPAPVPRHKSPTTTSPPDLHQFPNSNPPPLLPHQTPHGGGEVVVEDWCAVRALWGSSGGGLL